MAIFIVLSKVGEKMRMESSVRKIKYFIVGIIIGVLVFGGTLLYSQNFSLEGLIDASTMSFFALFVLGWFIFISNEGTLDILLYGVQAFSKAIVGKRMKSSYFDYTTNKERVDKRVFLGFWLSALFYLIVFVVLYIIYLSE